MECLHSAFARCPAKVPQIRIGPSAIRIEAASAVLHAAPGRTLNVVVFNKVLFYLDLAALRDSGETITRSSYIALRNGPVVCKYPWRGLVMQYQPSDGKWQVGGNAKLLIELRQQMTPDQYEQEKQALQEFLCGYFSSGDCNQSLGDSISPAANSAESISPKLSSVGTT